MVSLSLACQANKGYKGKIKSMDKENTLDVEFDFPEGCPKVFRLAVTARYQSRMLAPLSRSLLRR